VVRLMEEMGGDCRRSLSLAKSVRRLFFGQKRFVLRAGLYRLESLFRESPQIRHDRRDGNYPLQCPKPRARFSCLARALEPAG
jgi:hypothetical protein